MRFARRFGPAGLGPLALALALAACQPAPSDPAPRPATSDASTRADRTTTPPSPPDVERPDPPRDSGAGPDTTVADATTEAPAACPPPRLDCDTTRPLPAKLSETGLFPALPDLAPVAAAQRFQPAWPLWSDGLQKERQVIVPAGKAIDAGDRQRWQFPVGTLFLKTFFADGAQGGRRPIETRLIRRVDSDDPFQQWQYAVYAWNAAATEATLLDLQVRTPVEVTVGGQRFTHQIPSREDCGKCHEANATAIIAFDELRLAWTPAGASETELARFRRLGLVTGGPTDAPPPITDPDATLAALKGYVLGNCVHCHDGRNPTVVDMRPAVLATNMVCKPTTSSGTAAGTLVVPGKPETSIFYQQIARMTGPGINPMPPVGVQRPDALAVNLARRWITSLRTPCR
jgi:hypothetical protein